MSNGNTSLAYAVRPNILVKYLGQLLIAQACLMIPPLLASLYYAEYFFSWRFAIVLILTLALGWFGQRVRAVQHIQANEALVIVALAFVISPILMLYPMSAAGYALGDVLFETISAITTTGLTTVADVEHSAQTFLFSRAWMQWYGGLGIVVLSVALLMRHQLAARRLTEISLSENIASTARSYARQVLWVYVSLTLVGFLLLWSFVGKAEIALLHTFSAISTGGFSTYNNSLAGFSSRWMAYIVIFIAILGAIPLPWYQRLRKAQWREAWDDIEFRSLFVLGFTISVVLTIVFNLTLTGQSEHTLSTAMICAFTAQTGAGFSIVDIGGLPDTAKGVLILSMFIGGGLGSTSGGIKLLRFLVLLRLLQFMIQRTAMPTHAMSGPRLREHYLESDDIQRALLLVILFVVVIVLSWLVLLFEDYPALDALFEVVSATGTVGLSSGLTGSGLAPMAKTVLCIDMLLGRVEIIALLVVLYPSTWFGKRQKS